ncbi:uncharacterized protein SPAPADRAFT_57698 [Spathaspora passalidarum NRRL Y-27907]|uniref:Uncharacterized protein n=1 Tax=Spathaspora passalidarum (strain NRRL Y-27907 / 11-Y1) TaxID=619300 RepID=G3AGX2_SPAPN|nr:uncharacterized protein SPAPADRAFT_57698 [Spathaspora passalidarum NRRL Y-27907]EGW34645.1 hypothetical protein SPAPADRAFT_57698 [Spathaspora passalidarum NRRL Y-27907]
MDNVPVARLTKVCDFPPGQSGRVNVNTPRVTACVLVLNVEKNVARNSPCSLYVTDFTFNPQTYSDLRPNRYIWDDYSVPLGKVLKISVFNRYFRDLDDEYELRTGQELGLNQWYLDIPEGQHQKTSFLRKLLILNVEIDLRMYLDSLECNSYSFNIADPTDKRKEVQDLFDRMVNELPLEIFQENQDIAGKLIPSTFLLRVLPQYSTRLYQQTYANARDSHQQSYNSTNNSYQPKVHYSNNSTQIRQHHNTQTIEEYHTFNDFVEDLEHHSDYISTPAPTMSHTKPVRVKKESSQPIYQIHQLLGLNADAPNQVYTVNARVIDTSPSDWSLLCGKLYGIKNGKPEVMDPAPLDLELILVDATSNDKAINCRNSLSVHLPGNSVMEMLGIHAVEEMYINVSSLYERFMKYTAKPHKLELCRKPVPLNGEETIDAWTILNPNVISL